MKTSLSVLAGGLGLVSSAADASPAFTIFSYSNDMKSREQNIEVHLATNGNPMTCSVPGYFRIPSTAPNYQTIVSTILSAIGRGKQMSVYVYGCDADGLSLFSAVEVTE